MPAADRYLRTGTPVPQIYPGTLSALSRAVRDVKYASARSSGVHRVITVLNGKRVVTQVYEEGTCTRVYRAGR